MSKLNIKSIDAFDIGDAWYRSLEAVLNYGREYAIDSGSFAGQKRKELDYIVIHITNPGHRPLEPFMPQGLESLAPTSRDYIESYFLEYLMGAKGITDSEDYTYAERLTGAKLRNVTLNMGGEEREFHEVPIGRNQIEGIIERYKQDGYHSNQNVLQVAMPADLDLVDPPCLRQIDTKIIDDTLHFYPYFRSWDLWAGLPTNLGGIQLMKEYMADSIGVDDGEIIAASKGLHLYDYAWEFAKTRTYKTKKD